jgi:hypothetical protein
MVDTSAANVTIDARDEVQIPNGAAVAAILAAGIGSFAMGLIVILNELAIFTPPTLYEPSGGVTGRTTLAVIVWIVAWIVLHSRWKNRQFLAGGMYTLTLILILLGLIGTFPPLWALLAE